MIKSKSPKKQNSIVSSLSEDKLKIIIRLRPILNQQDNTQFVKLQDDNTLKILRPGNYSYMKFNNIIPPLAGQKDVFNLVEDSIKQFLSGINITLFAYGQTGAGKTYSMIGNYSPTQSTQNLFNFLSSKQRGILSRSLQLIMSHTQLQPQNTRVFVSFFEIYNEKIYDLYNNTLTPLEIRQSRNGQISIPQLVNVEVLTMEDAIQYLLVGLKNRATGWTHANAKSSRSHSIFQISIEKQDQQGGKIASSLRIVDLAGSQKFKIPSQLSPSEKQIRIQELTSINGSLSCLGHCISALIQKSRRHIPFRNSKLTRILSDSLLGQGKMRFIICISPSISASAETFSTLQFANRAKKVILERSQCRTPQLSKKKTQNQQILQLRRELQRQRQVRYQIQKQLKESVNFQLLGKQNAFLRNQNSRLKEELRKIMAKTKNQCNPKIQINKQNNFNEQMLKLPIFQKSRNKSPVQNPKNKPINRKKAEFQKKIKKFIQADSPVHQSQLHQYSFQDNKDIDNNIIPPSFDDDLWDCDQNDTKKFIQQACDKMNVPQFKDLRNQMERARQQLLNLKKIDGQIQTKIHYNK